MRRPILLAALALLLAAPAAAHAQATPTPTAPAGSSTNCPLFTVLHDDRIGALSLPAGAYQITIGTTSTLTCVQASDLFRQFLQDFDGRLGGGWNVNASSSSFSRPSPNQSFSVKRVGARVPDNGSAVQPTTGGICPATFQVLHDDTIGDLAIPAGKYTITLVSAGRMTCDQAATNLARFLQDYDGTLPRPWFVDAETATLLRGSVNTGFSIEPLVGDPPSATTLKLPGDGTPCPGVFTVQHNDRIGALDVPKGPYLFVPLANSRLTCPRVVELIRQLLAEPARSLPSPWVVNTNTGTVRRGKGSQVGFRLKPAAS